VDTFFGAVDNGKLILEAREAFIEEIRKHEGKQIVLEVRQSRKRSNQQNRYYWGAMLPIVQQGMKELGVIVSIEQTHELLKFRFLKSEYVTTDGEVIQTVRSTTELNPPEFNEYIANIQQWSAEYLGIDVPDPNEQTTLSI
jgi:hypothetical protein